MGSLRMNHAGYDFESAWPLPTFWSLSHDLYRPPFSPPQALKIQSTPASSCLPASPGCSLSRNCTAGSLASLQAHLSCGLSVAEQGDSDGSKDIFQESRLLDTVRRQ